MPKNNNWIEKELVGKNKHSVYVYCLNGCRTWGINMPLEKTCGNCGEPNGITYYDIETIKEFITHLLSQQKQQIIEMVQELVEDGNPGNDEVGQAIKYGWNDAIGTVIQQLQNKEKI